MSEATQTTLGGRLASWLKTILGTFAGILSGAFMMYLTPLVDKVIRPSKPVANFGVEHQGLAVTLVNRSAGGSEGWWDFGDGSPLEPFSAKQPSVGHTFPKTGSYNIKLIVRNLIGEENERVIPLAIDEVLVEPRIVELKATPMSEHPYAPATFRVIGKTENAQLCVWNFEDDQPLLISTDPKVDAEMGRQITFAKPGGYTIKLAAANGKLAKEKSTIVYVDEAPSNSVTALVNVIDDAVRLEKMTSPLTIPLQFPANSRNETEPVEKQFPARSGFEILEARLETLTAPSVRNLQLDVAPDRRFVQLTGELVRQGNWLQRSATPPTIFARAVLTQERRVPVNRPSQLVTSTVSVPGTAALPMPALPTDWIEPHRQVCFELRDGDKVIWRGSQLPRNEPIVIQNRRSLVCALLDGDKVRVSIVDDPKAAPVPTAN